MSISRRDFVRTSLGLVTACWAPGVFAEMLSATPRLTEGPFYPDRLPLDRDNDLVIVSDSTTPAVGQITHLGGRVLDRSGRPVRGAVVEIWQVDGRGVYLHSADSGHRERDPHFQGFGRFETDSSGAYRFRTIKPVPYPGRTPHIHVMVRRGDQELITTQIFVRGHPQNGRDGVLDSAGGPDEQGLVMADFRPLEGSRAGELTASFDIILGSTPSESGRRRRRG